MTVVTLRPNASADLNGSAPFSINGGAGSLHAATNDDSDTTYIKPYPSASPPGPSICTLDFGTTTLPAGAVVARMAIRYRNSTTFGGAQNNQGALRVDGVATGITAGPTVTWATPTTVSAWSRTAHDDGSPLAQGAVDSAQLYLTGIGGQGSTTISTYEVYLDVTYVAVPALDVIAPTGTVTTTNLPTVTWTDTLDSDGGAQTFYEVKIFNAAQYGAGGFDPSTSAPVTSSGGVLVGSDTSWTPTAVLPDDTYRAYARVAQTVNGQQLWSAWTFEGFIISVALPGAPTLAATAENASARVKLALTEMSGSATTDAFEIQRSADAGATWEAVRVRAGDAGGGVMDNRPRIVATGVFSDVADGTTHNAVLPAPIGGILVNDVLLAVAAFDGTPTIAWPAGWTEVKDEAGNGSAVRAGVAWKRAVGGETGTIAVTTSASEGGGVQIHCVRGAHLTSAPEVSTGVSAATSNANPDSLNPAGWDIEHTLWIAAMVNDGDVAVTAAPTNYAGLLNTRWANASGSGVATASRHTDAASEDPGAFTQAAEDTRAFTIGMRPVDPLVVLYDYEAPNGTAMKYRARAIHYYSGAPAGSAWTSEQSATWTSTAWWLKCPEIPSLNAIVVPYSIPSIQRPARQGVFQALGRADLVVVQDTRGGERGVLSFKTATEAAQLVLDALLGSGATLLLQAPTGTHWRDRYLRLGDHDRARIVDKSWAELVIDQLAWFEVSSPTGVVNAWPA
jgi:hypothetical protein